MFRSHKTDAPPTSAERSVASSDTEFTPPIYAAGTSTTHSFDDGSCGVIRSPEQSHRPFSSKRNSVFNLRARSNTAASTSSTMSFVSSNHADMGYADILRPESPMALISNGLPTQSEIASRKSLFRGKREKRLSGSVSASTPTPEYDDHSIGIKRMSILRKGRKRNNQHENPCKPTLYFQHSRLLLTHPAQDLKQRISSPFGFRHITHTNRDNFATIQSSSNKSGVDFYAHASQSPGLPEEQVSNAEPLHFNNFSSETLAAQGHRSPSALSFKSPPQSPQKASQLQHPATSPDQAERPTLRLTRSVESFSQPGMSFRNHHHSQSIVGPPRLSSLGPIAPVDPNPEHLPHRGRRTPAVCQSKRESGVWDVVPDTNAAGEAFSSDIFVGHALTTPDDTAIQAMTPPLTFSPSLDDVAEEPERFVRPRPAPLPPMRSPMTPRSPDFDSSIFYAHRSPASRRRPRENSQVSPRSFSRRASISSQASDTLGGLNLVRRESVRRPRDTRRQSNTWRVPEESWEADIDFAYEHAMEADCDFEWDRIATEMPHTTTQGSSYLSRDGPSHGIQPVSALQPAFEPLVHYQEPEFRASLLVPSLSNVPDLEPTSATSAYTMDTGLTTPCDPFARASADAMTGFSLSPSLLVPQEYKQDGQPTYEEVLDEYADSDRHFARLDPRHSGISSARSRRSSYDSSLMSSAQSSGMWSSPIRRSASSAGSIPELVPSRRSRRDVASGLVIDQLADSVASLSHLDEEKEDSDITPPGRILGNKTFFTNGEAIGETATAHASVEHEVRASLELARRGSQYLGSSSHPSATRSAPLTRDSSLRSHDGSTRHRKQAMSDGAAKLHSVESIESTGRRTNPRNRAATTSQAARSPLLSLFPSPPRSSPTSN